MKNSNAITKIKNLMLSGKKGFFLVYTAIFAVLSILIFMPFISNGKGFVWTATSADGFTQHYMALMYFGQWGREIITTLFTEGRLDIPLWDFSVGYGSDVITSMHYYAFGDPLNLASILVPSKYTEILYELLVLFRMYLSGLVFSLFSFKMSNRRPAVLAGAISYVFCGYTLYAAIRHPFFMNPMIYLPLAILGAEKILRKERPMLFIFAIFVTTISNFYFLYMTAIAVVLYVAIRYFTMERERTVKDFFASLLKFSLSAILGIGMACAIFLPVVNVLFGSNRLDQTGADPELFYDLVYYEKLVTGMFSTTASGEWTCLGFAAPIFVSVAVMFMSRKKYTALKIGFCVLIGMLCFPSIGKVMNGFSYVSNRWSYIVAGLVAYILVAVWDDLFKLSKKKLAGLLVCGGVYYLVTIFFGKTSDEATYAILSIIFAVIVLLALNYTGSFKGLTTRTVSLLLVFATALSCYMTSYYWYDVREDGYINEFEAFNKSFSEINNSSNKALAKVMEDEETFVRADHDKSSHLNTSVIHGNSVTQFYWSLENGGVSTFLTENALNNFYPQKYDGLNERAYLQSLASVKYFAKVKGEVTPYGFEKIKTVEYDDYEYIIYENKNPLPLGYTYSEYITREEYEKMTSSEKQQAMLQGVVLDATENTDLSAYKTVEPEFTHQVMKREVEIGDKIVVQEDGSYLVNKAGATITFTFEGLDNSETYFHIQDVEATAMNQYELYMDDCQEYYSREDFEKKSTAEKNHLKRKDFYDTVSKADSKLMFKAKTDGIWYGLKYCTDDFRYSTGQDDFLVNLGYSEEGKKEITFRFPVAGIYKIGKMEVICQPMDDFNGYVDALKEDVMVNEVIGTNSVSGEITLKEDKILALSIPYSQGWKATVDGEEVELLQANSMYMAIPLKAGKHEIKLTYATPMIKVGVFVSMISFGIFIGMAIAFIMARKSRHYKNGKLRMEN